MKKFNLAILAVISVFLTGLLCACNFKKVEANFSVEEVVVSQNDSFNLGDLLSVKGVKKSKISYISSDSSLISIENNVAKSSSKFGRGFVYAKYDGSTISSLPVAVKKNFDAPTSFTYSENGTLSWNNVVDRFDGTTYSASKYLVSGTLKADGKETPFSQEVDKNEILLSQIGEYHVTVQTLATDADKYFASSTPSLVQTLFFGYMSSPTTLNWTNGNLSWDAVAGGKYQVKLNSTTFAEQETTSMDLSEYFDKLSAGVHRLSVIVKDSLGQKLSRESDVLRITKLQKPTATYDFASGGNIKISTASNVEEYEIFVDDNSVQTIQNSASEILTNLNEASSLSDGLSHSMKIVAKNTTGLFYQSDAQDFGKVVKLSPLVLTGNGGEIDSNSISILASGTSQFETTISVEGWSENFNGLSHEVSSAALTLNFDHAGVFNICAYQHPKHETNTLDGEVFVLCSDVSESIAITVLSNPENVKHAFEDEKSTFTFEKVENATKYVLQHQSPDGEFVDVEQEKYAVEIGENVKVKLVDKIQNMFEPEQNAYIFRLVAKTENEQTTVCASTEKVIQSLSALVAQSRNVTDSVFTWQRADNVSGYDVNLYVMTKEQYNSDDTSNMSPLSNSSCQSSTSYELPNVNYYYITVTAVPTDVDQFVPAKTDIAQKFIYAKQLELGQVRFGYDEAYQNQETTQSSGYFLEIGGTDNISTYRVSMQNGVIQPQNDSHETNIFLLQEKFDEEREYELTIQGFGTDDNLFLPTTVTTFTVERLKKITRDDLTLDNHKNASITIEKPKGATGLEVQKDGAAFKNFASGEDWKFEVEDFASSSLTFKLAGSTFDAESKIYQASENQVWLPSGGSTISISRLENLTGLNYDGGLLKFNNPSTQNTNHYVLDLSCLTANQKTYKISFRLLESGNISVQNVDENNFAVDFPYAGSLVNAGGNSISINFANLVETMQTVSNSNQNLKLVLDTYNQATSIKFDVYAIPNDDEQNIVLSSNYAFATDGESVGVTVEKISAAKLSAKFDVLTNELTISWNEIPSGCTVTIQSDSPEFEQIEVSGSSESVISQADKFDGYSFWATVSKRDHLSSATSNKITIKKLTGKINATLTNSAQMQFDVSQDDKDHISEINITKEESKIEPVGSLIDLTTNGAGTYSFAMLGKTETNEQTGDITLFIDAKNTVSVALLSSLAPESQELTISGNQLSWNAFAGDLSTLNYVVLFKDQTKEIKIETTKNSLDWKNDANVEAELSSLSGEVTIKVFAVVEPYSVFGEGTIYFADEVEIGSNDKRFNAHQYTGTKTTTKMSTPIVTGVEFKNVSMPEEEIGELSPEIRVTFKGNYGKTADFNIYLGENILSGFENHQIEAQPEQADEQGLFTYTLVLGSNVYANIFEGGNNIVLRIYALNINDNEGKIPSAVGSVTIKKSEQIEKMEFEQGDLGLSHNLVITFNAQSHDPGDVVLVLNANASQTKYMTVKNSNTQNSILNVDLEEFISQNLSEGGTLSISAFIKSYSSESTHNLASDLSSAYSVQVLQSVQNENIRTTASGFSIFDINNITTTYYATHTNDEGVSQQFVLEGGIFNCPDDWKDGTYTLSIYAAENGYVQSATNKNVEVVLQRIKAVEKVEFSHGDLSDTLTDGTLSWDDVPDAKGYLVKVAVVKETQDEHDSTKYEVVGNVYEKEVSSLSSTLEQIFGKNYADFTSYLESFEQDVKLQIQIVTIPTDEEMNYSTPFTFYVTLKGNDIHDGDFEVNDAGVICFNAKKDDKTYLYRFVDLTGVILQNWKKMTDSLLSTSELDGGQNFVLQVLVLGSESATSDEAMFLDSTTFEMGNLKKLTDVLTLRKLDETDKVVEDERINTNDDLVLELGFDLLNSTKIDKIMFALSADALQTRKFVSVDLQQLQQLKFNGTYIYSYRLAQVIENLREAGLWDDEAKQNNLFAWAFKEQDGELSYVSSNYAQYSFAYGEEFSATLFRLGEYNDVSSTGEVGSEKLQDYINTYVFFEDLEGTAGVYAKITFGQEVVTTLIPMDNLNANEKVLRAYFQKYDSGYEVNKKGYVIDILSILDNNAVLKDVYGQIKIAFARVTDGDVYGISNWTEFEFVRIQSTENVSINNGNLTWAVAGQETTQYFVYLYSDLDRNVFALHSTKDNHFDATKVIDSGKYKIAVQAVNINQKEDGNLTDESLKVLASSKTFILDLESGEPLEVYRNQVTEPLKLQNGRMFFEWKEDCDLFTLLSSDRDLSVLAQELATTTFTSPFTFTLSDLVNKSFVFNMRFSKITETGTLNPVTISVEAINLLDDMVKAYKSKGDLLKRLEDLAANNSLYRSLINQFAEKIQQASQGIGNDRKLFDDCFEAIGAGRYRLEYCLAGQTRTLSSQWYTYANSKGEQDFYVNPQPIIKVGQEEVNGLIKSYTVIINKSKIFNGESDELATKYVMRLGDTCFEIDNGGVVLLGQDAHSGKIVSVEESETTLSFHLNLGKIESQMQGGLNVNKVTNNESILEKFRENIEMNKDLEMQIYAVGNEFSASSKSEKFEVNFLEFEQFSINDGKFVWNTNGRVTTIQVGNLTNGGSQIESVDQTMAQAEFSLEQYDAGQFEIRFVLKGGFEKATNKIFVDSNVLLAERVYRLIAPTLTNANGKLSISQNNTASLADTYSDVGVAKFRYLIYNDYSTQNLSHIFADNRASHESAYQYEVGATGMSEDDEDYSYKYTEEFAYKFNVRMLGSTADLTYQPSSDEFYERTIFAKGDDAENAKGLAVQSKFNSLSASMLDMVGNVSVEKGNLTWTAVSERSVMQNDERVTYTLPTVAQSSNPVKVVYRVQVTVYAKLGDGTIDEFSVQTFHTTSTQFDMTKVTYETAYDEEQIYYKVVLQAFAMEISSTNASGLALEDYDEEGRKLYAVGNVQYVEQSPSDEALYVLMGNGRSMNEIQRYAKIDEGSLRVENGKLKWNYTTGTHIRVNNFEQYYGFLVKDDQGKVVEGDYDISLTRENNTFEITFNEFRGQFSTDLSLVTVYVTQGSGTGEVKVNSYGTSLEVKKLGMIRKGDFDIESEVTSEALVLNVQIESTQKIVAKVNEKTITFDSTHKKLFIYSDHEQVSPTYPEGYVEDYLVIGKNEQVVIMFQYVTDDENVLFGDESDNFVLYRSSWEDNQITWNDIEQKFEWAYEYRSFSGATTGLLVQGDSVTEVQKEFMGNEIFKIVDNSKDEVIISYDDGEGEKKYQVSASSIANPTYIVTVSYLKDDQLSENRTYTTTLSEFMPTMIGNVGISVRVKINEHNLQSETLRFSQNLEGQQTTFVQFNLFESGNGVDGDEYVIKNEQQFKNIAKRLSKPSDLTKYLDSNGDEKTEDKVFHFKLDENLEISAFEGFLFAGEFDGVLKGENHSISYNSTANAALSNSARSITVADSNVYAQDGDSSITFHRGVALYERFGENAVVSDLEISAKFGDDTSSGTRTYNNTLLAGLVIENYGRIENVTLKKLESSFVGVQGAMQTSLTIMAYTGLVSINRGTISDCKVDAQIEISDYNNAQCIFLSGIAYTNYANINNCQTTQQSTMHIRALAGTDQMQLSGIVTTNASSGTITNCTNNANLFVQGAGGGRLYLAGIMALNCRGSSQSSNANNGSISSDDVDSVTQNDIFAVNR